MVGIPLGRGGCRGEEIVATFNKALLGNGFGGFPTKGRGSRAGWFQQIRNIEGGDRVKVWRHGWSGNETCVEAFPVIFGLVVKGIAWDIVPRRTLQDWEMDQPVDLLGTLHAHRCVGRGEEMFFGGVAIRSSDLKLSLSIGP
ncbi:hypothetical protein Acr_24g0008670 [Actinidia rufa]|uniref:Uncharacterized protein n=1 Tax=Actinidia rufa TaxID=165716 RepID=A0A7J0GV04_9ERIC|nr:hypothetical protein Acr_24g0008670 [Actinidia rufa]